jgi:hypothetical protein
VGGSVPSANAAQTTAANAEAGTANDSGRNTAIAVGVAVPLSVLAIIAAAALWFFKYRRPRSSRQSPDDTEPVVHRLPRPDGGRVPVSMHGESARWLKPQMYDRESSRESTSTLNTLPRPGHNLSANRSSWARTDVASTSLGTPNLACPPRF